MIKILKITVILLFLGFQTANAEMVVICKQNDKIEIKDKTKRLKTYTYEYWRLAEKEITKVPEQLRKKGFVVGDFHFNNLGIYFDYKQNIPILSLNDFDDAGENVLVIDLLKYISYLKKLNGKFDYSLILRSYIEGAKKNKTLSVPMELERLLQSDMFYFKQNQMRYILKQIDDMDSVQKQMEDPALKIVVDKILSTKLIKQLRDVRYSVQFNDSGSSKDMLRLEIAGIDQNGIMGIFEFKQLKCSASGDSVKQDLEADRKKVKYLYGKFDKADFAQSQFLYQQDGKVFLVREKLFNQIKKLNLEEQTEEKKQKYAEFYANYLGRIHSLSVDDKYLNAIMPNSDLLIDIAKKITKELQLTD